jgi:hypothetical protein
MEPLQDQAIFDDLSYQDLKPLTVNHDTLKIYSALRQCMQNNQELRKALVEATDTIQKLVKALDENQSN